MRKDAVLFRGILYGLLGVPGRESAAGDSREWMQINQPNMGGQATKFNL